MTISIAFSYSSVLENVMNMVAFGIGYKILAKVCVVHIFTVILWIVLRLVETMDAHSGYDFPWALFNWHPFNTGGKYHTFHHSHNAGNYGGSICLLETIMGTNGPFFDHLQKQQGKEGKGKKVRDEGNRLKGK